MKAHAWAIVDCGELDVRTVSQSPLAAIMNWLVVAKGHPITTYTSDKVVHAQWLRWKGGAACVPVTINMTPSRVNDDPAATFGA